MTTVSQIHQNDANRFITSENLFRTRFLVRHGQCISNIKRPMDNYSDDTKGKIIYVTHDWWISLFLSFHTPLYRQIGYDRWPDFLEGFSLCHQDRQIVYRDAVYSLPNADPA